MNSLQIKFHLFSCIFHPSDDLGMKIWNGDDREGAINEAFANEPHEVREFNDLVELTEFLAYSLTVGKAVKKIDGGIEFIYEWFDNDYIEKAIFTRVYCDDPMVLDTLWRLFQKVKYNPQADAQDWIETERDRYAPEL